MDLISHKGNKVQDHEYAIVKGILHTFTLKVLQMPSLNLTMIIQRNPLKVNTSGPKKKVLTLSKVNIIHFQEISPKIQLIKNMLSPFCYL